MKILNDGVTYFENDSPTIATDTNGDLIIIDDFVYPIEGMGEEDCVSIYIAQRNGESSPTKIFSKVGKANQTFTISSETLSDGYISFCHILLPTQEYYESHSENFNYYWDGEKPVNAEGSEVSFQLLVEVNDSKLIRHIHNFFYAFHLRKCYVSLCQKIFKSRGFDRCFNGKLDSQLVYKRDLVWAALNVIQYMIDFNQLAEAQRLLERINGCNGLCKSEDTGDSGCGCE